MCCLRIVICMRIEKGIQVDRGGRTHPTFTHNPSSLRLSCVDPNLQQIPRGTDNEVQRYVKEMFVAPVGSLFWARDYSGIEAVLVGYFAGSARYTRLAKLGVHAFLASHILGRGADLGWSDDDLRCYFKEIKKEKHTYDVAKRTVHASNYMVKPAKLTYEYPIEFPTAKDAAKLQGLYYDLFPEIPKWHEETCRRVDGTKKRRVDNVVDGSVIDPWTLGVCTVTNPFGYVHRFYNVLDWELVEYEGKKEWRWSYGEDAKRCISFLPQSTGSGILKRSTKRIWYDYPDVGETLRLLIHDEVFGECREDQLERCREVSLHTMEAPVKELPLDPSWNMGDFLVIGTDFKFGKSWAEMS